MNFFAMLAICHLFPICLSGKKLKKWFTQNKLFQKSKLNLGMRCLNPLTALKGQRIWRTFFRAGSPMHYFMSDKQVEQVARQALMPGLVLSLFCPPSLHCRAFNQTPGIKRAVTTTGGILPWEKRGVLLCSPGMLRHFRLLLKGLSGMVWERALGVSSKLHTGHPQLKLSEERFRVCDSGGHSQPPMAWVQERRWLGADLQ